MESLFLKEICCDLEDAPWCFGQNLCQKNSHNSEFVWIDNKMETFVAYVFRQKLDKKPGKTYEYFI